MKIRLLSVGKSRSREAQRLHDDYAERLGKLGVEYETLHVPEERAGGRFSDEHVKEREARSLLERIERRASRGTLVALHERGKLLTSRDLAASLESWCTPAATFVVGGPLGLHDRLLERCDRRWSLSPLTFPHEIARVLVAEQLYRAVTILRGIPYHK
jgi:23S rRNA (pseudouridine1915-N3)-methyltransferase